MKKIIAIVLVLAMCLSLTACKSKEARNVEKLIETIGEVTLESESAIISAENAYEALSEEDKAEIENYEILTTARTTLDALIYEAEMNAKYDNAIALLKAEDYEGAYSAFVDLGDWKDSAEYVSRFTVLENVILTEKQTIKFNLEQNTSEIKYDYDTYGRLVSKTGLYFDYSSMGFYGWSGGSLWTYDYDANGNLVTIKHYKDDAVWFQFELSYNDNGELASGVRVTNWSKELLRFAVDTNGNIVRMAFVNGADGVDPCSVDYGDCIIYTYDVNGILSRRDFGFWEGTQYSNPSEIQIDKVQTGRGYTYDENGNCIRWEDDIAMEGYGSCEADFIYGTYYLYTPA